MSWVCFRPLSTPQNICSEGQRILFLSLIYHRHTHGLNLNQPDDSTYVLLDVVRMPHCCVSQWLTVHFRTYVVGDREPAVLGLQLSWGPRLEQQYLRGLAKPLRVLSVSCGQCTGHLLLPLPLHPAYFPLLNQRWVISFILCRHGPLDFSL